MRLSIFFFRGIIDTAIAPLLHIGKAIANHASEFYEFGAGAIGPICPKGFIRYAEILRDLARFQATVVGKQNEVVHVFLLDWFDEKIMANKKRKVAENSVGKRGGKSQKEIVE